MRFLSLPTVPIIAAALLIVSCAAPSKTEPAVAASAVPNTSLLDNGRKETTTAATAPVPTPAPATYDVVILPTEEVQARELNLVVDQVARDTGLKMKVMLPIGTRDWQPYPDRPQQYSPLALQKVATPAIQRLKPIYGGRVYIIVTARDIGPADRSLNFAFVEHDLTARVSMLSLARMIFDVQGFAEPNELVRTRVRKMLLRTIALQYYQLPRSTVLQEVTYSPMMGVDDLDAMGLAMPTKKS